MYQFLRALSADQLWRRQLPAFTVSFVVAALFYKLGSFALECAAFLATWFVVDLVAGAAAAALGPLLGGRRRAGAGG